MKNVTFVRLFAVQNCKLMVNKKIGNIRYFHIIHFLYKRYTIFYSLKMKNIEIDLFIYRYTNFKPKGFLII